MIQTEQQQRESLKLELLAKAQDSFVKLLSERGYDGNNVIPIRAIRRPVLQHLRQYLGRRGQETHENIYLERKELRVIVEEAVDSKDFGRYMIGLRVDSKGIPKMPYQPTFIANPQKDGGQEYWVRKSYTESFNAGRR